MKLRTLAVFIAAALALAGCRTLDAGDDFPVHTEGTPDETFGRIAK